MPVRIDDAGFEECSRVAGVAVAAYTLRALERWRSNVTDHEGAMIMLAVIAISSARLLRSGELPPAYRRLAAPIDRGQLARVNIAGIAHATGLNRETARRKVNELIEQGQLIRTGDGSIAFTPGLVQSDRVRGQVLGQIGEIATIANQLERMGAFVLD